MFQLRHVSSRSVRVLVLSALVAAAALLLTPAPASAQVYGGIRGGLSIDPDQVYFGAHLETEPIVERLVFRPNLELGIGNDLRLLALNGEFVWRFPTMGSDWRIYAGAGPAINVFWFNGGRNGNRDAEMEAGFNFVGGFEHQRGLFFEFKVGALDSPDLKIGIGYTWR